MKSSQSSLDKMQLSVERGNKELLSHDRSKDVWGWVSTSEVWREPLCSSPASNADPTFWDKLSYVKQKWELSHEMPVISSLSLSWDLWAQREEKYNDEVKLIFFFVELELLLKCRRLSVSSDCLKQLFQMEALLLPAELNCWSEITLVWNFLNKEMSDKERRNRGVPESNTIAGTSMLWACNAILNRQRGRRKLSVWWPLEAQQCAIRFHHTESLSTGLWYAVSFLLSLFLKLNGWGISFCCVLTLARKHLEFFKATTDGRASAKLNKTKEVSHFLIKLIHRKRGRDNYRKTDSVFVSIKCRCLNTAATVIL